jgi:hypothetical protein
MSPQDAEGYIDGALMGLNACVPVGASCMACYVPRGAPGAEPMTSVHASAFVKRDLAGLARAFDPRSWSTCAPEAFQKSQRVTYSETTLEYADVPHSPSDLGNPWTGLLEENVVVGGTATFQNWLEIDFTVEKTSGGVQLVRVDYELFESGAFSIPAFWISNEVESVTLDEGHLLAEPSTHVSYPASDGWVYVRMVKRVRFVDLTDVTGTDPWQLDPGEVLNYWAPVALGAWLEAGTQGFVCCNP